MKPLGYIKINKRKWCPMFLFPRKVPVMLVKYGRKAKGIIQTGEWYRADRGLKEVHLLSIWAILTCEVLQMRGRRVKL